MTSIGPGSGAAPAPGPFLARLGFEEPLAVFGDLEALGAWPPHAAAGGLRLLHELGGSANPELATRALAAIAAAQPDGGAFTDLLRRQLGFRRRLVALVAASRSLGAWLVAHPGEVDRLADGRVFAAPRSRDELVGEALAAITPASTPNTGPDPDPAGAWDGLRRFKRRELLRIAVRDLAGGVAVEVVAQELAALAEACLEAALAVAARRVDGAEQVRVAVLGMGKLGGEELNYVSDIDVLFCHQAAPGAEIGADEAGRIAAALARELIGGLSAVTAEGTCYRVDANLRPEGRNGPLTRTLGSYQAYWERWAEAWEQQALLKVRPVAGDRALGEDFHQAAAAWTYPERLDPEAIAAIRHMKVRVEASQQARAGGERQVKLGPGGLRDVEFAVQLLQLVHGRHDAALRSGSTLVALEALSAAGFVGRSDAAALASAYRFLRMIEHRLQLASELRTHTIPPGEAERRWLARTMGYRDGPDGDALELFEADRRRHAATVRGLHEKLFYRPLLEVFGAVPTGLDPQEARERLAALGYANPDRAMAHLRALTSGLSRRATLFRAMLPAMLTWLAEAPDPDGGLGALRVVAEALGRHGAFLATLRDNPAVAELLCTVLGSSRLLGDLLARHPELLTAMAEAGGPAGARTRDQLVGEALAIVARHLGHGHREGDAGLGGGSAAEVADAWDGLRRFKRRELLRIAVRDLVNQVEVAVVGQELAALAEACLEAGLAVATRRVDGGEQVRVAVLGMGKLGGEELSYTSDLDVLLCHEPAEGADPSRAAHAAAQVARELLSGLGAVTREGTGFKVDANLRPEGRNGPLTRTLGSYQAYWERWAEAWEQQALLKVRPVAGDRALGERFHAAAAAWSYPQGLDPETVAAIRRMKARVESERLPAGADPRLHLKLGPGGLADVEWTVQLLQLRFGGTHPEVRRQGTLPALAALADAGALDHREAGWLADAYRLCLRLRNLGYLVAGRPVDSLPTDPVLLERLAETMGEPPGGRQRLLESYRRATRRARRVVMARFWDSMA